VLGLRKFSVPVPLTYVVVVETAVEIHHLPDASNSSSTVNAKKKIP